MKRETVKTKREELRRKIRAADEEFKENFVYTHSNCDSSTGRCSRCGGNEADGVYRDLGFFRGVMSARYCKGCYPDLSAWVEEWVRLDSQQDAREERCKKLRKYRTDRSERFSESIGRSYESCWFRTYTPQNDTQGVALDQVQKWAGTPAARDRYPFLLLVGPPGVGKSHLAVAAWRMLSRRICIPGFADEARFNLTWRQSHEAYSDRHYRGPKPDELIADTAAESLLVWDDLGKARLTDAWFGAMFEIINTRYAQRLPTLFTTNYGADVLAKRIDPSLADRVASGIVLTIEGNSMRRL